MRTQASPRTRPEHTRGIVAAMYGLFSSKLRTFGLALAIVLIAIYFQTQRTSFFSSTNLYTIIQSSATLVIMCFAELMVLVVGELDLSVGAVYGLAATSTATLWLGGGNIGFKVPFLGALAIVVVVCGVVGAINAALTTFVGIPSFIVTLGMLSLCEGLDLFVGNSGNFNPTYNEPRPGRTELRIFNDIGGSHIVGNIPIQVLWLIFAFMVFFLVLQRTRFGFRIYAAGGSPQAAHRAGIPIRRYKFVVFAACSITAGICGIIDFSYVGSVGPESGVPFTFPVFAAVVIGGASLSGGKGSVGGALLGAVLLAVLQNGLALLGAGAYVQLLFVGFVTIAAVGVDRLSSRVSARER